MSTTQQSVTSSLSDIKYLTEIRSNFETSLFTPFSPIVIIAVSSSRILFFCPSCALHTCVLLCMSNQFSGLACYLFPFRLYLYLICSAAAVANKMEREELALGFETLRKVLS